MSANARLAEKWGKTENIEWSVEIPGRGWSSPVVTGGKVFITAATTDGPSKSPQIGTEHSNEYVAELTKPGLSEALPIYLNFGTGSSPVRAGHLLVIVNDNEKPPFIAAYDTKTGNVTAKTRIDPSATAFTSSPWAYNGKGFFLGEEGRTFVVAAGETFQLLRVNELDDMALASPALAGDRLLLRTQHRLSSIRPVTPPPGRRTGRATGEEQRK